MRWTLLFAVAACGLLAQDICIHDPLESYRIAGQVLLDVSGKRTPVSDAVVEISVPDYVVDKWVTASDGRFEIRDVKPGRYELRVLNKALIGFGVEIRLTTRASATQRYIVFVLRNDPARPCGGGTVSTAAALDTSEARPPSDESNCESVNRYQRWLGGFEYGHIDNDFGESILTRVFHGRVVGQHDGEPLERALIQVRGKGTGNRIRTALTNSKGEFHVRGLPAGYYHFVAVSQGFQSVSGCLQISDKSAPTTAQIPLPLGV